MADFLFHNGTLKLGGGTAASSDSILELASTTQGFLPPRLTTTQRDAISSPNTGLIVFNTTTTSLNVFNGFNSKSYDGASGITRLHSSAAGPYGSTSFSVSFWAKFTDVDERCVFSTYNAGKYFVLVFNQAGSGAGKLRWISDATGGVGLTQTVNTAYNDGNWHHFVASYDNTQAIASALKFYVDGALAASTVNASNGSAATDFSNAGNFYVGWSGVVQGTDFLGKLDEVSTYTSALSAGTVTTLYNSGTPYDITAVSTLDHWYRMGDSTDSSSTIFDRKSSLNLTGTNTITYSSLTPGTQGTWSDSGANPALSNLSSPTAINQSLLFGTDGTKNIGAATASRPGTVYAKTSVIIGDSTASFSTLNLNGLFGNTSTIQWQDGANIQASYASLRVQGPSSGYLQFDNSTGLQFNTRGFYFTGDGCQGVSGVGYNLGTWGRPAVSYSTARLSVGNNSIANTNPTGGMLNVNAVSPWVQTNIGATITTTVNASTAVTVSNAGAIDQQLRYNIGVGDYVFLTGIAGTVGRVTAITGATSFTSSVALGDGTSRALNVLPGLASFYTSAGVEALHLDYNGKSYFGANIYSATDGVVDIGSSLGASGGRPNNIYAYGSVNVGIATGSGAGGKILLLDGNFGGAQISFGTTSQNINYHGGFFTLQPTVSASYTWGPAGTYQWASLPSYGTSDDSGTYGRNTVINGGFADYYWGRNQEIHSSRRISVGAPSGSPLAMRGGALSVTAKAAYNATGTSNANASTTIPGTSTAFRREIGIGDYIQLVGLATVGRVTAIASDTSLTVDTAMGDGTARAVSIIYPVASFVTASGTEAMLIDRAGAVVVAGDVTIGGNVTVNGTTTNVNTANLNVTDKNITVNNGGSDATAPGAGITVARTSTAGSIAFDASLSSSWKVGLLGSESMVITAANIGANETDPLSLHLNGGNSMAGNILFATDNLYNIGASGANRPANIRFADTLYIGPNADATANTIKSRTGAPTQLEIYSTSEIRAFVGAGGAIGANAVQYWDNGSTSIYGAVSLDSSTGHTPHLTWVTDGSGNIGTSAAAGRPQNIYARDTVVIGSAAASNSTLPGIALNNWAPNVASGGTQIELKPGLVGSSTGSSYIYTSVLNTLQLGVGNNLNILKLGGTNPEVFMDGASNANLKWSTDGAGSIGGTGANRPANINLFTNGKVQFNQANNNIKEVTNDRLRITGLQEVDLYVGAEATYSIAVDASYAYFQKPIGMNGGAINIEWITDGTGNIGASATTGRPTNVFVKSKVVVNGYHLEATEFGAGNSGTTKTLDFSNASSQSVTMTGNCTFSFSNTVAGGSYVVRILGGAGGFSISMPVTWLNSANVGPAAVTSGSTLLVNIYYDGTTYWGSYAGNYAETYQQQTQASVQTTDATVTTIQTVPTVSNTVQFLDTRVTAFRVSGSGSAGDSAYFWVRARVKNIAGTVTVVDVVTEASRDIATWDAVYTVSGTNVLIQVNGAATTTVDWNCTTTTQSSS